MARQPNKDAAAHDRPQGDRLTILVVDDEAPIRDLTSRMLARFGHKVLTCDSGQEGIDIVTAAVEPVDLVVLDMKMPGLSGDETFRKLKQWDRQIKVIFISGYVEEDAVAGLLAKGAVACLRKPFSVDQLVSAVRKASNTIR